MSTTFFFSCRLPRSDACVSLDIRIKGDGKDSEKGKYLLSPPSKSDKQGLKYPVC